MIGESSAVLAGYCRLLQSWLFEDAVSTAVLVHPLPSALELFSCSVKLLRIIDKSDKRKYFRQLLAYFAACFVYYIYKYLWVRIICDY